MSVTCTGMRLVPREESFVLILASVSPGFLTGTHSQRSWRLCSPNSPEKHPLSQSKSKEAFRKALWVRVSVSRGTPWMAVSMDWSQLMALPEKVPWVISVTSCQAHMVISGFILSFKTSSPWCDSFIDLMFNPKV